MIPLFVPLLTALRTQLSSAAIMATQEGPTFEARIKALFETKICKLRLRLSSVQAASELEEQLPSVLTYLGDACLKSSLSTMRFLGAQCILCLARTLVSAGEQADLTETVERMSGQLGSSIAGLLQDYLGKKSPHLNSRLAEDLVQRFPDMGTEYLSTVLAAGVVTAKTTYLRGEALRMYTALLKKASGVKRESALQALYGSVDKAVAGVCRMLSEAQSLKPKAVVAVVGCCRELALLLTRVTSPALPPALGSRLHSALALEAKREGGGSSKGAVEHLLTLLERLRDATPGGGEGVGEVGAGEKQRKRKHPVPESTGHQPDGSPTESKAVIDPKESLPAVTKVAKKKTSKA